MITLTIYDHEIDIVKRALVELRDSERRRAREPSLLNADRAHEIFERLVYSNRVGCRAADAEIAA